MFTGIIENIGIVELIELSGKNITFTIKSELAPTLKVDQSVAHNGVCLTVIAKEATTYKVTAIAETLSRTNLGTLLKGSLVNLERCLLASSRLDGHLVQGHVDTTAVLESIIEQGGSWLLKFSHKSHPDYFTVEKGSICVNGVSLTVVRSEESAFEVAIIPYTWENTNISALKIGESVNIEFDIMGKYMAKMLSPYLKSFKG